MKCLGLNLGMEWLHGGIKAREERFDEAPLANLSDP
jgi:hypothetical protein